jgi:hypothetical protein
MASNDPNLHWDGKQWQRWDGSQWLPVTLPPPFTSNQHVRRGEVIAAWIIAVLTGFYMLPWAVAATRGKANSVQIAVLNLLLGWTIIGWIVALVMAFGAHQIVPSPIPSGTVTPVAPPPATAMTAPPVPPPTAVPATPPPPAAEVPVVPPPPATATHPRTSRPNPSAKPRLGR